MMAAVSYRGEVLWSRGYGVINRKSTTVPDGDTIFRVGSISKVFAVREQLCTSLFWDYTSVCTFCERYCNNTVHDRI